MKTTWKHWALIAVAVLIGVLLANLDVKAQGTPVIVKSCCEQAIDFKKERDEVVKKYNDLLEDYNAFRDVVDKRHAGELGEANAHIKSYAQEAKEQALRADKAETQVLLLTTQNDALDKELRAYRPKTWVGKKLRGARNALAWIGGVTVATGGVVLGVVLLR